MPWVQKTVQQWDNLSHERFLSGWGFYIADYTFAVGFIPDRFFEAAHWDRSLFEIDGPSKSVRLLASDNGENLVHDCNKGLLQFCEQNQHVPGFAHGLQPWLKQRERFDNGTSPKPPCYHPIFSKVTRFQGVHLPSPIRGIMGIITAGAHMNAYNVKVNESGEEVIDKIFVSKRGPSKDAYASCFDQIAAGSMDSGDQRKPWITFQREAMEEAGYYYRRKCMYRLDNNSLVGVVDGFFTIYFCTEKDATAGKAEQDHIEPGVRFCFDMKITDPTEVPRPKEAGISGFQAFTVEQIKQTLRQGNWKPNSGLVMLDFLLRKNLLDKDDKEGIQAIQKLSNVALPLDTPHFLLD